MTGASSSPLLLRPLQKKKPRPQRARLSELLLIAVAVALSGTMSVFERSRGPHAGSHWAVAACCSCVITLVTALVGAGCRDWNTGAIAALLAACCLPGITPHTGVLAPVAASIFLASIALCGSGQFMPGAILAGLSFPFRMDAIMPILVAVRLQWKTLKSALLTLLSAAISLSAVAVLCHVGGIADFAWCLRTTWLPSPHRLFGVLRLCAAPTVMWLTIAWIADLTDYQYQHKWSAFWPTLLFCLAGVAVFRLSSDRQFALTLCPMISIAAAAGYRKLLPVIAGEVPTTVGRYLVAGISLVALVAAQVLGTY